MHSRRRQSSPFHDSLGSLSKSGRHSPDRTGPHELNGRFVYAVRGIRFSEFAELPGAPRIDECEPDVRKVSDVSGGEGCTSRLADCCDLRVELRDGATDAAAVLHDVSERDGGSGVECNDSIRKMTSERGVDCEQ